MKEKKLIRPSRIRILPSRFSWMDQRFVREVHIKKCSRDALSLYFFLVIVGDRDGLSYYSSKSIAYYLNCTVSCVEVFRNELINNDFIAYKSSIYQVLSLDFMVNTVELKDSKRNSEPQLISEIIKEVWS